MICLVYELEIYVPVLRMKLANSRGFIWRGTVSICIDLGADVESNRRDTWGFFFLLYIWKINIFNV